MVALGRKTLAEQQFRGRSTEAQVKDVPMPEVAAERRPGGPVDLTFRKEGAGTLHYMARLRYASSAPVLAGTRPGLRGASETYRAAASGADTGEPPSTAFAAGDLVRVTLTLVVPKERRYVAVTDPLPAGLEPVETLFATTAADLARDRVAGEEGRDWTEWWRRGGFDRVERHDDRVLLFATRLAEGEHVFSYVARATTAGRSAPRPPTRRRCTSPRSSAARRPTPSRWGGDAPARAAAAGSAGAGRRRPPRARGMDPLRALAGRHARPRQPRLHRDRGSQRRRAL